MVFNTVGRKLLWGIGIPALLVATAGLAFYWHKANAAVSASIRSQANELADLVAHLFALERAQDAAEPHAAVAEALHSGWTVLQNASQLRVITSRSGVRWSKRPEEEGQRVAVPTEDGVRFEAERAELVRPLGGPSCAACHAEVPGVIQLTIDAPALQREVTGVFESALTSILAFAAALALATVLSLNLFLRRPLRRLAAAMARAEEGDFLARADASSNDEIGALARAFNQMLARITAMKAEEIDTHRDLANAQEQLALKQALEHTNAQLEHRVTELSTLYDVARSLTSTLELKELFARITALVPERLNIPQFSIMLVNERGQLEVKSALPAGVGTEGLTFELGEGACGRAAASLEAVYIPDLERDTTIYRARTSATRGGGSLLSLPMLHGGSLLGVMNFERPEKEGFSPEEIDFLTAVTGQVAMAVKNARLHEQTVQLSLTDALTGVPNRRHLFSRLEMEIARANRFGTQLSLLMVDIDHFKKLNDAAGHRAGDTVLREVCELMKGMIRRVDTLARYGGEEFVLVLPQVTKAEALEVAEKLRRIIEEAPLEHARYQPGGKITISVGVANLPVDSTEQDRLVDCADSALYASKRAGRNKVTGYAPGMELHPGRERGPHAQKRSQPEEPAPVAVRAGPHKGS